MSSTGVIHLPKGLKTKKEKEDVIKCSRHSFYCAPFVGCPKYSLWCLDIFLLFRCLQTGLDNLQQLNQQLKNPTFLHHSGTQEFQFLPKPNRVTCYGLCVVWVN